jgi:hypothetical protein
MDCRIHFVAESDHPIVPLTWCVHCGVPVGRSHRIDGSPILLDHTGAVDTLHAPASTGGGPHVCASRG